MLSNLSVTLGVMNALDQGPPDVRVRPTTGLYDLGFDPTNGSPLGRLITLDLMKRW